MKGRVHSFQSLGAVDGPGLRFVVFLQGCRLRCAYCHNPDTWNPAGGDEMEAEEVFQKILRYRPYFGKTGGVTISGGEPLLQPDFVSELFRMLRKEGVHTALDTAGFAQNPQAAEKVLEQTDLVLCDLKFSSEEDYRRYTGGSLQTVLGFLAQTEEQKIPLWIRHVVVPGLTDGEEQARKIAQLSHQFSNLKKIELLPFRKLCIAKYDALGIPFPLREYKECDDETIKRLSSLIEV